MEQLKIINSNSYKAFEVEVNNFINDTTHIVTNSKYDTVVANNEIYYVAYIFYLTAAEYNKIMQQRYEEVKKQNKEIEVKKPYLSKTV